MHSYLFQTRFSTAVRIFSEKLAPLRQNPDAVHFVVTMATRGGIRGRGTGKAEAKQEKKLKPTDDVDGLTVDQLNEEQIKAQNELAEVRRNRNFYQLERVSWIYRRFWC